MSIMCRGWWRSICGYLNPLPFEINLINLHHCLHSLPFLAQFHLSHLPLYVLGKDVEFLGWCCTRLLLDVYTRNISLGLFCPECSFSCICHLVVNLLCVKLSCVSATGPRSFRSPVCSPSVAFVDAYLLISLATLWAPEVMALPDMREPFVITTSCLWRDIKQTCHFTQKAITASGLGIALYWVAQFLE